MKVQVLNDAEDCLYQDVCPYHLTVENKKNLCSRCKFQPRLDIPKLIKNKIEKRNAFLKRKEQNGTNKI